MGLHSDHYCCLINICCEYTGIKNPRGKFPRGFSLLIQRELNKLFGFPNSRLPLSNVAVLVNYDNGDEVIVVEVSANIRSIVLGQFVVSPEIGIIVVSQIDIKLASLNAYALLGVNVQDNSILAVDGGTVNLVAVTIVGVVQSSALGVEFVKILFVDFLN